MTIAKPTVLELAKQGNPKAIEALLNRQLQPKGITTKVVLKNSCLQIMLEAAQVPTENVVTAFIKKGIETLAVPAIKTLKIYGRQTGDEFPAWSQKIELAEYSFEGSVPKMNSLIENSVSHSKNKELKTALAQEVLAQYLNLKARVTIGISYTDFSPILGAAKLAVQKFERSQDSKVFIGLTELIMKIMLYYELSLECYKQKVANGGETTYFFGVPLAGIERNSPIGKAILNDFPELYSSLHKFDVLINTLWNKAIELTDKLDDALTEPMAMHEFEKSLPRTAIQQSSDQLARIRHLMGETSKDSQAKNKVLVGILGIFLGAFGLHKFVLGYKMEGLIMLLISILSGGALAPIATIIGIIEGLIYISKTDDDFIHIYIKNKRVWF